MTMATLAVGQSSVGLIWPKTAQLLISFRPAREAIAAPLLSSDFSAPLLTIARTVRRPIMLRLLRYTAYSLVAAGLCAPLAAQTAANVGPPAWQDEASVYLTMQSEGPATTAAADAAPHPANLVLQNQSAMKPAGPSAPIEDASDISNRHLAPPSRLGSTSTNSVHNNETAVGGTNRFANFVPPLHSFYTVVSGLAIVVGIFLLCVWVFRRGGRGAVTVLPADVVSVLGRVPLAAREYADLLRVGNKLVLVARTPTGPIALTEITDPLEVDRLVGLCQQSDPHSTTKAFEQVFRQMAREPAPAGFLGQEAPLATLPPTIGTFRAQRGDAARA